MRGRESRRPASPPPQPRGAVWIPPSLSADRAGPRACRDLEPKLSKEDSAQGPSPRRNPSKPRIPLELLRPETVALRRGWGGITDQWQRGGFAVSQRCLLSTCYASGPEVGSRTHTVGQKPNLPLASCRLCGLVTSLSLSELQL